VVICAGGVLNPTDRTYVNHQFGTSYHAEQRVADVILKKVSKQCIKNNKVNEKKLKRKLRKYTILVYRDEKNSTPCQICSDYLYDNGFRKIICTHNGELVKYNLADYRSSHLSDSQKKFKIQQYF
jgi:cytidine deaminase